MAEGEIEYESDPEEARLSLKMRRREASDDEQDEMDGGGRAGKPPRWADDDSDGELEGAAAEYDDELEEEEYVKGGGDFERVKPGREGDGVVEVEKRAENYSGEVDDENIDGTEGQQEEERKDVEPSTVPTAGAFYMHDDRFGDRANVRNRRTLGRKIWESKDDRKWGHDKFEGLTTREKSFEQPRSSRGRNSDRGRNRGTRHVNPQEYRPIEYSDNSTQNDNNQVNGLKSVKGRGPSRYQQSSKKSYGGPVSQNKQSVKSFEKHSYVNSGRAFEPVSNTKLDELVPRKQVASGLNISSPPFYPTGSSSKDNAVPLKRYVQVGTINRNSQQSVVEENLRKNIADSIGVGNLCIDVSPSVKPSNTIKVPISQLQGQGRGLTSSTRMVYQPVASKKQSKSGPPSQGHNVEGNTGQNHFQASNAAGAANVFESGEPESASEPKTTMFAKGKGSVQGSGKGPFLYGGSDKNLPTFLPVMKFGGQRTGGMGIPAVGMAFPGYVAQSQHGIGSSEMTWLPILTGAAGAMGASYFPPYNDRPSGQMPSMSDASSRENNAVEVGNDVNPAQNLELANNHGQMQKNTRRYTEMKFDQ